MLSRWQSGHRSKGPIQMAQDNTPRERKLDRLYQNRDGEVSKKLTKDVYKVLLQPKGGTTRVEADIATLFPNGALPEPCIALQALAFGLNTVLGNAVAGKDGSPEELAAMIQDRWDAIAEGEWSEGREGPRLTLVIDAWAADFESRKGTPASEEQKANLRAKLESEEYTTKDLLKDAGINAAYQNILAQRAIARAKEAQAAAAGAEVGKFDQ